MDLKSRAEFDKLMTAARIQRRRGDYEQATELIRQVLDIDSENPEAREFAADMLFAAGKLEVAAEAYRGLFEEDASRASAEDKYARAIIQIAEGKRQQDLLREMLDNPSGFRIPPRQPFYAALLSLGPGLGHAYCGQITKGVVLFVSTLLSWWLFYTLAGDCSYSGLSDSARELIPYSQRIKDFLTPGALLFGCAAVFLHIYALIDAPVAARRMSETARVGDADPGATRRAPSEPT